MNKRFMTVVAIASTVVAMTWVASCGGSGSSRRDATTVGADGWIFEGWACAPDAAAARRGESPAEYCEGKDKKEMDYLYMKFPAAASERSIASGRQSMMASTCRAAALTQVKGDNLAKIVGEYVETVGGTSDGQSTGEAIIRQSSGIVKGTGIYDCCAVDENLNCAEEDEQNWEQCMCVGYMRYPGGQDKFMSDAEKATGW